MEPPTDPGRPRVVVLAGGVGGARLAYGLQALLGPRLTVVVNTADDLERYGLSIWPDHDTVLYTLAGREDTERGWGLRDESWTAMAALDELGESAWFRLGDRDLATHLARTARLVAGDRPTAVAAWLRERFEVAASILPMADAPVRTEVRTDDGWLAFQDYFVRQRQAPAVREVCFRGIEAARPTPEVAGALAAADAIVIAPSNPFVSIGPILALPGLRSALLDRRSAGVPVVAISPIVGGRALKGPADRMLASLGHEVSATGVARLYEGLVDTFVVDGLDAGLAPEIAAVGLRPLVTESVMTDGAARARLAGVTLAAANLAW